MTKREAVNKEKRFKLSEKKRDKIDAQLTKIFQKAELLDIDKMVYYLKNNEIKIDKLINKGADVSWIFYTYFQNAPIMENCTWNPAVRNLNEAKLNIAFYMLENFNIREAPYELKRYPMYTQDLVLAKKLFKYGVNFSDAFYMSWAVGQNNYEMCEFLLGQPLIEDSYNNEGTSKDQLLSAALCRAAREGKYDMIKWLVDQGADASRPFWHGDTTALPLHALVREVADLRKTIDDQTKNRYLSCAKFLIDNGADPYREIRHYHIHDILLSASGTVSFASAKSAIEKYLDNPAVQIALEVQKYYHEKQKDKTTTTSKTETKTQTVNLAEKPAQTEEERGLTD